MLCFPLLLLSNFEAETVVGLIVWNISPKSRRYVIVRVSKGTAALGAMLDICIILFPRAFPAATRFIAHR